MEISRQIKKYRLEAKLSQEELAEKVYVTRQTISNWENDRNYPDINSLVLLSTLFDVSLDILVKGDLEEMKEKIKAEDIKKFNRDGGIFTVLLIAIVFLAVPLFLYLSVAGIVIWFALVAITGYYAGRVEQQKKKYNIQTYKEIVAFTEGKKLDEIVKGREPGQPPYKTALYAVAASVIGMVVGCGMFYLLSR